MSDDAWVNKDVRVPKGSYLASSHETPGAERALLFDRESGNNLGPAELKDPQPQSEPDNALRDCINLAIGAAVTLVVVKGPDMKRGLRNKVLPAIKRKWDTVFTTGGADSPAGVTEDEPSESEARPSLVLVQNEAESASEVPAA